MNDAAIYYWVSFVLSLYWILKVPSKLKGVDNLFGSLICAMFGFLLWPLYLAAYIKTRKTTT